MKASTVIPTAQAPTFLPAPVQPLFLTEFSQTKTAGQRDDFDEVQLHLRATTITVLLKEMLAPSCWEHGGLNE